MNRIPVGEVIEELITKKGLKKYLVAEALGIGSTAFSNYLSNKRQLDFDQLIKIADYFNVSTDYLLGRRKSDPPSSSVINEPLKAYGGELEPENFLRIIKILSKENERLETQLKEYLSVNQKNISSNVPVTKLG